MNKADLAISFGCRFSPQFVGHEFKALSNAKVISVDIEKDELNKKGQRTHARLQVQPKIHSSSFTTI